MVSPSSAAFYGGVARTLLARDIWTKPGPRIPCITQLRSRHTFGLYIVVHYSEMHMSLRTPYSIGTRNNCIFDSIAAAIRHMVLDGSRGCAGGAQYFDWINEADAPRHPNTPITLTVLFANISSQLDIRSRQ